MKRIGFAVTALFLALMLNFRPAFADITIYVNHTLEGRFENLDFANGTSVTRANDTHAYINFTTTGTTAGITSGAINGAVIGGVTPAAGTFTNLAATGYSNLTGPLLVNGTKFMANGVTGNTDVAGLLNVTGIANFTAALNANGGLDRSSAASLLIGANNATSVAVTPNTTVTGTLAATGNFAVNTSKMTVNATTGNVVIAGSADITGTTNSTGALGVTGNFAVNGTKFMAAGITGNTDVAGSLNVTGKLAQTGDFAINATRFTFNATTGGITAIGPVGYANLSVGSVNVSNTLVTNSSEIFLSYNVRSGTGQGSLAIVSRAAGGFFNVNSSGGKEDNSSIMYMIVN